MFSRRLTLLIAFCTGLFAITATSSAGLRQKAYSVEVHNHSTVVIDRIYMSPSSQTTWGRDRLGSTVLEPRHYITIEDVAPGRYDFMFVDEDERKCQWRYILVERDREVDIDDERLEDICKSR